MHTGKSACVTHAFLCVKILGKSVDQTAHDLMEAYHIRKRGPASVIDTSIALYSTQVAFEDHLLT